jgi:DNA-binding transcriptional ArsR family regulator
MNTLAVLADPTRQHIVEMLAKGALSSGDIARRFDISAPAISQHLKKLREAKLVRVHVDAQRRIYELDARGVDELSQWVADVRAFWSTRLAALQAQIEKESQS